MLTNKMKFIIRCIHVHQYMIYHIYHKHLASIVNNCHPKEFGDYFFTDDEVSDCLLILRNIKNDIIINLLLSNDKIKIELGSNLFKYYDNK